MGQEVSGIRLEFAGAHLDLRGGGEVGDVRGWPLEMAALCNLISEFGDSRGDGSGGVDTAVTVGPRVKWHRSIGGVEPRLKGATCYARWGVGVVLVSLRLDSKVLCFDVLL
jgi:hypothetical protein